MQLDMYKNVDEKLRAVMRYSEVTCLSLSFRGLVKISNLQPFITLQQLQLDNNDIKKIENLEHMVRPCSGSLSQLGSASVVFGAVLSLCRST